ncbi:LYR motif-containing protein 2 isoform X4 [Syngnathoides biaculeatus]|uniref:LYR motif-containing protein 2 isoform X4 n=1 Tax=Syngnathoides biaculeatus TaxID=300417 RepID=UPI002ADD63EB|nr:LYR motif-containing protein 2 isoform X4 [Syngnathoides biaculeatus]
MNTFLECGRKLECPEETHTGTFLQRQNILGIYRNMLRTIRYVPDAADRKYLRDWAREEFKRNKHATDQDLQASLENLRLPGSLSGCSAAVVLETKQGCYPNDDNTSSQPFGGASKVSGTGWELNTENS